MSNTGLSSFDFEHIVKAALDEDISYGDVTTNVLVPSDTTTRATMKAKQALTVAGIPVVQKVFEVLDPTISLKLEHGDGLS